jgi:hypothetical protein
VKHDTKESAAMIHPYQLNSLGKLYHEEALREARVRHLGHQARAHHRSRLEEQGRWSFSYWIGKLAAAVGSS